MQPEKKIVCPDCEALEGGTDRRGVLARLTALAAGAAAARLWAEPRAVAAPTPKSTAETAVKALYEMLSADQKKLICFEWDHQDKTRGLLRTHVSNNWH